MPNRCQASHSHPDRAIGGGLAAPPPPKACAALCQPATIVLQATLWTPRFRPFPAGTCPALGKDMLRTTHTLPALLVAIASFSAACSSGSGSTSPTSSTGPTLDHLTIARDPAVAADTATAV